MNEQKKLILGELKKLVKSTVGKVTPTAYALQHSGSPIVAQHKFKDASMLVVYQNGFAQYSTSRNYTVLRVEDCGAYRYTTSTGECIYSEAYFGTQPWEIRLLLEAEETVLHAIHMLGDVLLFYLGYCRMPEIQHKDHVRYAYLL